MRQLQPIRYAALQKINATVTFGCNSCSWSFHGLLTGNVAGCCMFQQTYRQYKVPALMHDAMQTLNIALVQGSSPENCTQAHHS